MAYRDKNQGHQFCYVDIAELLKRNRECSGEEIPLPASVACTFGKQYTKKSEIATIKKEEPNLISYDEAKARTQKSLNKLQSLHKKINKLLEDLGKKSK